MIAYGIGILPVIKNLRRALPDVTQPWYDDYARDLGMFAILETYFDLLPHQVPVRGYHPKPSKSVLIVCPDNIEAGNFFGRRHGFKVCTGARYLGGYIKDDESKRDWLRKRTLTWEKNINTISKTMGKYPQEIYARSSTCNPIRMDISSTRHLVHGRRVCGSGEDDLGNLLALSFLRKNENPLPYSGSFKYNASQEIRTGNPEYSDVSTVEVLKLHAGERRLGTGRDGRRSILQCWPPPYSKWETMWQEERLVHCVLILNQVFSKQPQSYWQAPINTRQNHRCLAERMRYYSFRYITIWYVISGFLCACYNVSPINLQSHCDGCGTVFGVTHTISCSIDVLVIARHRKIRDWLLYLPLPFRFKVYNTDLVIVTQPKKEEFPIQLARTSQCSFFIQTYKPFFLKLGSFG